MKKQRRKEWNNSMDGDDVDLTVATMVSDILQSYSHNAHRASKPSHVKPLTSLQVHPSGTDGLDTPDASPPRPITHNRGNVPRPTSLNAVTDVKVRLKEYKEKIVRLEDEIRTLEQTLIDERTKASLYKMEQDQLIASLKETFKRESTEILTTNKQIIEKLLVEKKELAEKYEELATELHKSKMEQMNAVTISSDNEILHAQLEKLKQEYTILKTTMDDQVEKAKHKILAAENKKKKQAVEEAVEQTKKTLALGLEPKLQEIEAAHKSEILQLNIDHETAFRKQKQELVIQHEENLTKQRAEIMKQAADEIDLLREEMQQKIKRVRAELREEHALELENVKKRLQMEYETSTSTEAAKLRSLLNEKSLECDILNDKLQKVTAGARKSVEDLKLAYISEVDKYKLAYTNEISVIKTQYKELARTLWLQSKPELTEQIRTERDNILRSIAKTWDEKVEAIRAQERESVLNKEAELVQVASQLRVLESKLDEKDEELVVLQAQQKTLNETISKLALEKELMISHQTSYMARLYMNAEDHRCSAVQQKIRRREFEARIKEKVQEKILSIVQEKDTLIDNLTTTLEAEQQRAAEYLTQLAQLQELTSAE